MKLRQLFAAAFVAVALSATVAGPLALSGCASLGVQRPESFDEKMVAGYKTVEAVADSTGILLASGKIDAADARNVHTQATTAKEGLDITRQIHDGGDFGSAEARLQSIIVALGAIQAYLAAKGA